MGTLFAGFEGTTAPTWLTDLLAEGLAGVVLFERNVVDAEPEHRDSCIAMLTSQLRAARPDVIVAVDEEGGDVTRLDAWEGSSLPGAAALGAVDDVDRTRLVARWLGGRLRDAGIGLNLAPVADVDTDPLNPIIGVRAFGATADLVSRHVRAFVRGQQYAGVAATVKHFPGHGATVQDSHETLPVVTATADTLRARELAPFVAGIDVGVQVVMTAHVVYPHLDDVPATLSHRVVTELLRDELGFGGVVMSDGLDMNAISQTVGHSDGAVQALVAGVDALCIGGESAGPDIVEQLVAAISHAVRSGRLSLPRLVDAVRRVGRLAAWTSAQAERAQSGECAERAAPGAPPAPPAPAADPGLDSARRAVRAHGVEALASAPLVLECHDDPTIASGEVPWAVGAPLAAQMPGTVVRPLTPRHPDPVPSLDEFADRPLVLAVRGLRRRPWQREVLAAVRAHRPDVVVVNHELPSPQDDLGHAYLITYSGSRVSAQVAADVLSGRMPLPSPAVA